MYRNFQVFSYRFLLFFNFLFQTLQSKDETSNLIGCNGDGFLLLDRDKTTTFYEERHVIYTVTENSQVCSLFTVKKLGLLQFL